jgi:hypothetical protein
METALFSALFIAAVVTVLGAIGYGGWPRN